MALISLLEKLVIYRSTVTGTWSATMTRSQAVARIADRTAKNSMGHVT